MNRRNDRTLTPSHPSGEGLLYSQDRALFTSIEEMGVFFKLHVLQIASVANCMCCELHVLQIVHVAYCMCCKLHVLQIASSLLELLVAVKNWDSPLSFKNSQILGCISPLPSNRDISQIFPLSFLMGPLIACFSEILLRDYCLSLRSF